MLSPSLSSKLYTDQQKCLHSNSYHIWTKSSPVVCGACYFRDGVLDELPTRTTIRRDSGTFGAPEIDPLLIEHAMVTVGLVPPLPGQALQQFRIERRKRSQPNPRLFPFTSALWELVGKQPPLARVMVLFCQGYSEVEIADRLNLSLYNAHERLRKSIHTSKKFLKVDHGSIS